MKNIISEKVLILGRFKPSDLIISVSESTRKIDPIVEVKVDSIWEEKKRKAEAEGRVCYNGISYRLNSLAEKNGKLALDFGLLEFKARESLPAIPEYLDLPEEYFHKGSFSGATVRTSDGKYAVAELSGKSMNVNRLDLLGGIIEKPTELRSGEDLFGSVYDELEEEAHIRKEDIENFCLRAIYLTAKTYTGFYFEIVLKISSEELAKRFAQEGKDQDIRSIKILGKEEYAEFLKNHPSPTKQLICTLLTI